MGCNCTICTLDALGKPALVLLNLQASKCNDVQICATLGGEEYQRTFLKPHLWQLGNSALTRQAKFGGMATMTGDGHKFRTLIVDDDSSIVRLIAATLNRRMSDLLEVSSTIEPAYVWGMAASGKVDICVTDMDMPAINGFRLLRQLKELNPLTQVIFLTAQPTLEAARSAFSLGADDFLAKPLNLDTLCESLRFMAARAARWQVELTRENSVV